MSRIDKILAQMDASPDNVRFSDFCKVCEHYFGDPRQNSTSHRIYTMPWPGDPRVNIQDFKGKCKPYQVRQVLKAIEKLKGGSEANGS
jgi:hypothetical protein